VVDLAGAHGLLDNDDLGELVTLSERTAPERCLRVPADCDFAEMSFASVGRVVSEVRKDSLMADSAVLSFVLVKLGLAPDAIPVSAVVGLRGD